MKPRADGKDKLFASPADDRMWRRCSLSPSPSSSSSPSCTTRGRGRWRGCGFSMPRLRSWSILYGQNY